MFYRVEVTPRNALDDPQGAGFLRSLRAALPAHAQNIQAALWGEVYWVEFAEGLPQERVEAALREVFWDPVLQKIQWSAEASQAQFGLEKRFRAGVTDNVGKTSEEALRIVLGDGVVRARSGALLRLRLKQDWAAGEWRAVSETVFCNPLIESWKLHSPERLAGAERFSPDFIERDWPRAHSGEGAHASTETVRLGCIS